MKQTGRTEEKGARNVSHTYLISIFLIISSISILTACGDNSDSNPSSAEDPDPNSGSAEDSDSNPSSADDPDQNPGSANNPDPNSSSAADSDTYFIGGSKCHLSGARPVATIDEDGNVTPIPDQPESEPQPGDIDCGELPDTMLTETGVTSIGVGTLTIGTRTIELNGMASGSSGLPDEFDHYGQSILLHDGEFRSLQRSDRLGTTRLDWGIYNASVAISVELFVSGGNRIEDLSGKSFDYTPLEVIEDPSLMGSNIFFTPTLFLDENGDHVMTQADTILDGSSGQFTWQGNAPDISLSADVGTVDGSAFALTYSGDFSSTDISSVSE